MDARVAFGIALVFLILHVHQKLGLKVFKGKSIYKDVAFFLFVVAPLSIPVVIALTYFMLFLLWVWACILIPEAGTFSEFMSDYRNK